MDSRPVLIGYVFGPKKMRSMGAVMNKASRAVSLVKIDLSSVLQLSQTATYINPSNITRCHTNEKLDSIGITRQVDKEETTVITEDESSFGSGLLSRRSDNGLRSILSYGQINASVSENSSLSSRVDLVKKGEVDNSYRVNFIPSTAASMNPCETPHMRSMTVSFLPLDLNLPIEEQHGGKFDVIIHKITEDILCKSHHSPHLFHANDDTRPTPSCCENNAAPFISSPPPPLQERDDKAVDRVERLTKYKLDHPACCLLDHPNNVQAVLSRCDIACTLSECLKKVMTKSGIPVRTPRFHMVRGGEERMMHINNVAPSDREASLSIVQEVTAQINNGLFNYPIIAKPLTAAGTVESHEMAVILSQPGLKKVHYPCLLQEYANHDELLFKVYVLGDKVWVFSRPSLPNLPKGESQFGSLDEGYVEFDSQQPYPKASDFGISQNTSSEAVNDNGDGNPSLDNVDNPHVVRSTDLTGGVTAEEIQPVADCLRRAFGLELFGFDIILVQNYQPKSKPDNPCRRQMFVIDVNYFPSYKEVPNFPELLAKHLAQCAIEGRVRSFD